MGMLIRMIFDDIRRAVDLAATHYRCASLRIVTWRRSAVTSGEVSLMAAATGESPATMLARRWIECVVWIVCICVSAGLFCYPTALFCWYVGLFCCYVGLFCWYVGLIYL